MIFQFINPNEKNYFLITNYFDFFSLPLIKNYSKFFGYFKRFKFNKKQNFDFHILFIDLPFTPTKVYEDLNTIRLCDENHYVIFKLTDKLEIRHNLNHLDIFFNLMPRYSFYSFHKKIKFEVINNLNLIEKSFSKNSVELISNDVVYNQLKFYSIKYWFNSESNELFEFNELNVIPKNKFFEEGKIKLNKAYSELFALGLFEECGWKKLTFDYDISRNSLPNEYWMYHVKGISKYICFKLHDLIINNTSLMDEIAIVDKALQKLFDNNSLLESNINNFEEFKQKKFYLFNKNDLLDYSLNKFFVVYYLDSSLLEHYESPKSLDLKFFPIAGFWWFDDFWTRDALWSLNAFNSELQKSLTILIADNFLEEKFASNRLNSKDLIALDSLLLTIYYLIDFDQSKALELLNLLKPSLENSLIISPSKTTWTDTLDRPFAIELNALWYEINKKLNFKNNLLDKIIKVFNKKFDYNIILAYYISNDFEEVFLKYVDYILQNYSISTSEFFAITTENVNKKEYVAVYSGENGMSYHRGDAWLWISNLFAHNLIKLLKKNRINTQLLNIVKKIISLNLHYYNSGMLFSLPELTDSTFKQKGSLMQLWSVATFKILRNSF